MKKILITEEQLNMVLQEELGIAREVTKLCMDLKQILYNKIEEAPEGEFNFLDIKVKYHVYSFNSEQDFWNWFQVEPSLYINGYSYKDKLLILTIININGNYNVSMLNDTIQHELEHYYQTKNAKKSFVSSSYKNAFNKMDDYNLYIKWIYNLEYYSKKFEIDAIVNGAYAVAKDKELSDFNAFIEETELKDVKEKLYNIFDFFNNIKFDGLFYNEMIGFILTNDLYKNCKDVSKLRKCILNKCQNAYDYFIRKSSRAYTLIKMEQEKHNSIKSNRDLEKLKRYYNDTKTEKNDK